MTEKQKVILILKFGLETCNAALAFVSSSGSSINQNSTSNNFIVIRKEFLSLLSLLDASTTKVSLTLNPSNPAHKASLDPLKDVIQYTSSLAQCAQLFRYGHGLSLFNEAAVIVKDVVGSIQSLLRTLLMNEDPDANAIAKYSSADYLARTGAIHEAIERSRTSGGFSEDNLAAVRKLWQQAYESLVDALNEVTRMCEDVPSGEDLDGDDDWDEFGLESNGNLSEVELERAKKVQSIVRLVTSLYNHAPKDLLNQSQYKTNTKLDILATHSTTLLGVIDELVSSLYSPQSEPDIVASLTLLKDIVRQLQSTIIAIILDPPLEEALVKLNVSGDTNSTDTKKYKRWYDTCFEHINKSIQVLDDILK